MRAGSSLADAFAVELVGGDTTRGPLNLCLTILGEAPAGQALRRSGARAGERGSAESSSVAPTPEASSR